MSRSPAGPMPYARVPVQPSFNGWCTDWTAFDVPRIWEIVAFEDNPRGWEQVDGFRQLADLLVDHHRRLKSQHFNISQAWQSPAATEMLRRVESFAESLLSDAQCALSTAHALHHIMTTYADARVQIDQLHKRWGSVTTDLVPEWWDSAAAELNAEAQAVMAKTDESVRDYRTRILVPDARYSATGSIVELDTGDPGARDKATGASVPPIPGRDPLVVDGREGPNLASSFGPFSSVPASPGQPVSLLPIPPGSPYAPLGGAYVLPGPGVGPSGFTVHMPVARHTNSPQGHPYGRSWHQPTPGSPWGYRPAPLAQVGVGGNVGTGPIPMPYGTPQPGVKPDARTLYRRGGNMVWSTETGVPSVIEGIGQHAYIANQPSRQQEEAFREWFAELAYPWRSEAGNSFEPHVVLRRTPG